MNCTCGAVGQEYCWCNDAPANEKELTDVVQEFWQPKKGMTEAFTDAARLIIEARRERDDARKDAMYWQDMHEYDAGAMADKWRKAVAERDAALARVKELETRLVIARGAAEVRVWDMAHQRGEAHERVAELEAVVRELTEERDHHAHWHDHFRLLSDKLGFERDAALERVEALEALSQQIQGVHVDWVAVDRKHRERIAQLEAELEAQVAAFARLRDEFDEIQC